MFFVDGKAFSIGDQLSFQDMQGNELAFIKQKLLAWEPAFEIFRGGQQVAVVKKKLFSLFKFRFIVDVPRPDDLRRREIFSSTSTRLRDTINRWLKSQNVGFHGRTLMELTSTTGKTTCSS